MSSRPLLEEHGDVDADHHKRSIRNRRIKSTAVFIFLALLVIGIVIPAVFANGKASDNKPAKGGQGRKKRNHVIMMVSDGMGPSSLSLARSFAEAHGSGLEHNSQQLFLDQHLLGTSRTRSSDHIITDSAAGATAFSCGLHSYNNAIAVDKHGKPCGTVLEAAKLKGYATGLVVTSDITDATPAAFSAHVANRSYEATIASQQIGLGPLNRTVDLMFGGGLCHFLPGNVAGSCRPDKEDLLKQAQQLFNFTTVTKRSAFEDLKSNENLPVLGLFGPGNLAYEIDRVAHSQPSLSEMVSKALDLLVDASDEGMFLMIEGSRIDMASHTNDPAAHAYDILEYQKAFKLAAEFIDTHGGTLVATSDHETGGVATGLQSGEEYPEYVLHPEVLLKPKHSAEYLGRQLREHAASKHFDGKTLKKYIEREIVEEGLGLDAADLGKHEIALVMHYLAAGDALRIEWAIASILSVRAGIGYSTHGHTAADVLIFGKGEGLDVLRGNHENTEIGMFLAKMLDVDVDEVTRLLNA